MAGVEMPGVVQPLGQGRQLMAAFSVTWTYCSLYRPLGQSLTTFNSQKRPGGTSAGYKQTMQVSNTYASLGAADACPIPKAVYYILFIGGLWLPSKVGPLLIASPCRHILSLQPSIYCSNILTKRRLLYVLLTILTAHGILVIVWTTVVLWCLQTRLALQASTQLVQAGGIGVANALGGIASLGGG
jgi:hypothetical protein